MAKLNKELQENLKEINKIIFNMAEIENDFIISTNIHNEMIVVSINSVKDGEVEIGDSFYLFEGQENEVDAKLAAQNDASEISVTPTGNLTSTNVQAALVELQGDIDNRYTKAQADTLLAGKVDNTVFDAANLNRADKYLANQNIVNMLYTNGDLTKIRYRVDSDTDYETLSYVNGNLTTIGHYINTVLKGTTTLSYTSGNLVSAIFVGV